MKKSMKQHTTPLVLIFIAAVMILSGCYSYTVSHRVFTPVPTLMHATMVNPMSKALGSSSGVLRCSIRAVDLLGAWVGAGYPETDVFTFTDLNDANCEGTFPDDVQNLFLQSNLWYEGAPACVSCHNSDLEASFQNMDLSSFAGIVAGAQRESAEAVGVDILGGGVWEESRLYEMLITKQMPLGRPADTDEKGPVVFAGSVMSGE